LKRYISFVVDWYKPLKCLDLGCGLGFYVKYLRDRGVDAWGVEGKDLGDLFKSAGHQIQKDLRRPFDLNEKYELVLCLEVVEHITREFEDIVFDNILRHMKKYLVFSGATVGQKGTGHVNERNESYWFAHLVNRGLVLKHQESVKARLRCSLPWLAKNISIWELVHPNLLDRAEIIANRDSHIIKCEILINNLRQQLKESELKVQQMHNELDEFKSKL
jgi:SAM-dependent methyltransferase